VDEVNPLRKVYIQSSGIQGGLETAMAKIITTLAIYEFAISSTYLVRGCGPGRG